jgi:hypothetical protein
MEITIDLSKSLLLSVIILITHHVAERKMRSSKMRDEAFRINEVEICVLYSSDW